MIKDSENLEQLWKEIGKELPQVEPDRIGVYIRPGYAIDESGYVAGVNLHQIKNLETIPLTLSKFKHLKKLSIFGVNIRNVNIRNLSMLEELKELIYLSIFDFPIRDISFLRGLSNLTTLKLRNNKIDDISFLRGLSNLTHLGLRANQPADYSFLQGLNNLTTLDLRGNQLTDISFLQGLSNLTYLDLRQNKIKELPEAIVDLGMKIDVDEEYVIRGISLYGNPLEKPPVEIIRKGKKSIKAYFKSLEKGKLPLNEVKVLLVGDGGAGKTSLVKRLMGKRFNKKEPQTHGIKINQWKITAGKEEIKAHLWDFGGQEIMHATHQFFLSERSLYILMLDSREDKKPEYWLKHIRSFGGNSPVLVVLNKIDQNPGFEVNRQFLMEKYPNIKGFYRLSCAENKGIKEFARALKKMLRSVEMISTTWPQSWFQIKQHLENMNTPFISYNDYREICTGEEIKEKNQQDTLVDFLNDLGVILHFKDLDLKGVHVLEPKWVTEAVYKIINFERVADAKGILKLAYLDEILMKTKTDDYDYPPEKYHYIIQLMKKFELCYEIDKDTVLIPDLLDVQQSKFKFNYAGSLKFHFQYDFLPRSVMPRFIVRMHTDIKDNCRWRTGVVLENSGYKATAVVKADNEEKRIHIFVSGEQKRDYFSVIRHTFRAINHSFDKLNAVEKVPLPGNEEIAVDYDELTGYEEVGEESYLIGKLKKRYSVKQLLNGIEKEEERKRGSNIQVIAGRDVTIVESVGDNSQVVISKTTQVEQKLELIIHQLKESSVEGKEELIAQLQDEEVKKDREKLSGVLGTVITRAAEIGTVVSTVASLLKLF